MILLLFRNEFENRLRGGVKEIAFFANLQFRCTKSGHNTTKYRRMSVENIELYSVMNERVLVYVQYKGCCFRQDRGRTGVIDIFLDITWSPL